MTTDTAPAAIGHNLPPIAEILAELYSPQAMARDHSDLFAKIDDAVKRGLKIEAVSDQATHDKAAELIKELRNLTKAADDARTKAKKPFLDLGRAIDGFFKPVEDAKNPLRAAGQKARLETLVGAWVRAEAERKRAEAAAAAEAIRKKAEEEAAAAAKLEDGEQLGAADAVMGAALALDDSAARLERMAAGSSSDLARTKTEGGVSSGLRKVARLEVTDEAAARATLGPLGPHFPADAIVSAARAFAYAERQAGHEPALPGVRFWIEEVANVR